MPSYERELDLVQGYNFKKDVQTPIGFLTSLTIGDTAFTADQVVSTPIITGGGTVAATGEVLGAEGTLAVVSVLKRVKWDLGDIDPVEFDGTLSITGKQLGMSLLYAAMININIKFSYVIFEYDPLATMYFMAFSSSASPTGGGKALDGLVRKEEGTLKLEISPNPSTEVQSPENYEFKLVVVPQAKAQTVYLAAASTRRVTKFWGRTGPKKGGGK